MKRNNKTSRRRGFAVLYSLILMSLLAAAFSVVTAMITRETRRTAVDLQEAQLRQLLRVGGDAAVAEAARGGDMRKSVALPSALAGWKLEVAGTLSYSGREWVVEITASPSRGAPLTEVVRLEKTEAGWKAAEALLNPDVR